MKGFLTNPTSIHICSHAISDHKFNNYSLHC